MRFLSLLALSLFFSQAFAQDLLHGRRASQYTYVYELSDEYAKTLYLDGPLALPEDAFDVLVDSFLSVFGSPASLSPGHYVQAKVQNAQLHLQYLPVQPLQVQMLNDKESLHLMVYDAQGQSLKDAQVNIDGRNLAFDPQSQSFHAPFRRRGGLLEVSYQGQTNWHSIDRSNNSWNFRRIYQWVFNLPSLRLISWRLFRLGNAIVHPYYFLQMPRNWWNTIVRRSRLFYDPQNRYRTYVALNKPIYRKGDTLKAKIVLLKRKNGKAADQKIEAFTYNRDGRKLDIPLKHPRKGVYLIDWVLTDSLRLQLDRYHTIQLAQGKTKLNARSSFRFEDYELSRVKFELRVDSNKVYAGIPMHIYASAKDENGLAAPDARIKLSIVNQSGDAILWKSKQAFLPDTLWQWEQVLDPIGETVLTIPDSIWPAAVFFSSLAATIYTSDQESQSFVKNLQYEHQESNISFAERLDSVEISYHQNGKSLAQKAWVQLLDQSRLVVWEDSLQLPLVLPLRGTFSHITVNTTACSRSFDFGESMLQIGGERTRDSLKIVAINPRNLPIWYSLFKGNKLIDQGQTTALQLNRGVSERQYYFLSTRYVWKGKVIEQDFRFRWYPNQVNLKLEHPAQVAPGSLVPIKITVTDVDSQAIADFDLALYGHTAKFQQSRAPKMPIYAPSWENRRAKLSFNANSDFLTHYLNRLLDYPQWAAKAGLDTLAWYHFRYPSGQRYQYSFPIDLDEAQFAPFIFHEGLQCKPIIIYLDDKPIYYQAQTTEPFSFRTTQGYHNIKVRLRDRVIQMDSVWLEGGNKTIVSVDKTKLGPHTTWRSAKPELSVTERRVIRQYFIPFRFPTLSKVSVTQGKTLHYIENPTHYVDYLLGPFDNQSSIKVRGVNWEYEIPKKTDLHYEIFPNYAQLTAYQQFRNRKTWLSSSRGEPFEVSAIRRLPNPSVFQSQKITQAQALWRIIPGPNETNICRWQSKLADSLEAKVAYTWLERDGLPPQRIYPGYVFNLRALPIGSYRLTYFLGKEDSLYAYMRTPYLQLRPQGINYSHWESLEVHAIPDSMKAHFLKELSQAEEIGRLLLGDPESIDAALLKEQFPVPFKPNFPLHWTKIVSGVVLDAEYRMPLVGVSVVVQEPSGEVQYGVLTDENGRFKLKVESGNTQIQLRYIAHVSQNLTASWIGEKEILMVPNHEKLEEVIVVGYGSTAAQDVVNNLVYIDGMKVRGMRDVSTVATLSPGVYNKEQKQTHFDLAVKGMPGVATNDEFSSTQEDINFEDLSLIDKENDISMPFGDESASSLRTNFRDYAFWYPNLKTGADGTLEVQTRIPDDITLWDIFALGHNDQRQLGKTSSQMQAYRMLSGQIVLPRFLLPGDSLRLIGKSINYLGDTIDIQTEFAMEDSIVLRSNRQMTNVVLDTAYFRVPRSDRDSLQFRYQLTRTRDGYQDGEQRTLPIYRPGIEETEGKFWAFWQDSSLTYRADSSMGPLFVNVEADLLSSLRTELKRLRRYPYECNEQAASKLLALLYERKISQQLGESFLGNKEIRRLIRRLLRHQNKDTSWGWWPNMEGQMWISLHVAEALLLAREEGFSVDFREEDLKARLLFEWKSYALMDQYRALDLLSQLEAKLNYQGVLDSLLPASYGHSGYLTENYLLRKRYDLPMEMDSLMKLRKQSQFGSYFWGAESYNVTDNAFLSSLRVFELLRTDDAYEREAALTLNYLLAGRKPYYWRNTYESASALAVILPDLIEQQGSELRPRIWVNGRLIEDFPFRDTLAANAQLELRFEGRLPVYATAYQRYWNEKPQAAQEPFQVKTYFLDAQNDTLARLQAGKEVRMIAELELVSSVEYVSLQLPIPAGCSYNDKRVWWRNESYREYKRQQTEIYCRRLPAGTHRFEVKLMPRFAGDYTLRTTRAEMMYFPLFFGQNEQKRIEIR